MRVIGGDRDGGGKGGEGDEGDRGDGTEGGEEGKGGGGKREEGGGEEGKLARNGKIEGSTRGPRESNSFCYVVLTVGAYLIFVISFTLAGFSKIKFYTQKND